MVRRARSQGLIDPAPIAAVDATGLETRHVSAHFGPRRENGKGRRQRAWPKLTTALHTRSHLLLAAVPGTGPSQDSPDFTRPCAKPPSWSRSTRCWATRATTPSTTTAFAVTSWASRQTVIRLNRRNTGRRWPKPPYRRAMRRRFPKATHHQRWHVEIGFSQHKRRLGSALTARNGASQGRELILRVLTHNLMPLAETASAFQQSNGVSHHSFLENTGRLNRDGGYLGGVSLVRGAPEADAFLNLIDYASRRQPHYCSIVCNSIASALRGEFGDHHVTDRTSGTELFINPLMTQYWAYEAEQVVGHMEFAALAATQIFAEASRAIKLQCGFLDSRPLRPIPL